MSRTHLRTTKADLLERQRATERERDTLDTVVSEMARDVAPHITVNGKNFDGKEIVRLSLYRPTGGAGGVVLQRWLDDDGSVVTVRTAYLEDMWTDMRGGKAWDDPYLKDALWALKTARDGALKQKYAQPQTALPRD